MHSSNCDCRTVHSICDCIWAMRNILSIRLYENCDGIRILPKYAVRRGVILFYDAESSHGIDSGPEISAISDAVDVIRLGTHIERQTRIESSRLEVHAHNNRIQRYLWYSAPSQ